MRWDLESFCKSLGSENFPLCSYKKKAILVYVDGFLSLLFGFHQVQGQVHFSGNLKINLSPPLPDTTEIERLSVSDDGSRVVLIGRRSIHLVLILPDIIALRTAKKEYFCECTPISMLGLGTRSKTILEERWLPTDDIYSNSLAVLFSDSTIRIFSFVEDVEEDSLVIDFGPFLSADTASSNTFGLFGNIVSFDFVNSEGGYPTLIAIDSEGDMYSAFVSSSDSCLIRPLIAPPSLPCDPVSLICVPHPFDKVFSVLSVFTPSHSGLITHIIAVPTENGGFDLTVEEKLNMPVPTNHLRLLSSDRKCSYLLATSQRLYFMDIRPWILTYGQALLGAGNSSSLPDSRLHNMTIVMSEPNKSPFIGQTAIVACTSEDGDNISLFATRFSNPLLATAFLRSDMIQPTPDLTDTSTATPTFKETVIDPILAKKHILPSVAGGSKISEEETLEEMENWTKNFMHNIAAQGEAYQAALTSLADIPRQLAECKNRRNNVNQRISNILESFSKMQERVRQKRASLMMLLNRIDLLANRLAGKVPLSSQESKMLSSLKEYRNQIVAFSIKFPQLSLNVAEEKRSWLGPALSFQPSANSVTATINRSGCEIDALQTRVKHLENKLVELSTNESVA